MEAIHKLRVECPYEILKIEDIEVECKPNEHGILNMKCLIDDRNNFNYSIKASTEDKIYIYEEIENDKKSVIFNGIIQNVRTTNINGIYYLEIEAVSSSFNLDIEEKSRSFQDTEMTYDELIEEILKDYKGFGYSQRMKDTQKIGRPLFQYKETDFKFLKRIASYLGIDLICDIIKFNNMFYFGRPKDEEYVLENEMNYRAYKNLTTYYKAKSERGINFNDTDFFFYEVEKREKMNIGDKIQFKQKDLYVNQFKGKFHQGELIYTYRLCRENGIWQEKIDNIKLKGISLEGKVIAVQGEKVKLHLDIDKDQGEDKACWFDFAPPTGDVMYSMPIVGTKALLYFSNINRTNPIVTGCVRKNGSSYSKFSDTNNRYYTTEDGNQMTMMPGSISFMCSGNEGLSVSLEDGKGVTLKSDKKISLTAPDEIIMKTETKVTVKSKSNLKVQKGSGQAGISLENDMYCFGGKVNENGTSCESCESSENDSESAITDLAISVGNIISALSGAISTIASVVGW